MGRLEVSEQECAMGLSQARRSLPVLLMQLQDIFMTTLLLQAKLIACLQHKPSQVPEAHLEMLLAEPVAMLCWGHCRECCRAAITQ